MMTRAGRVMTRCMVCSWLTDMQHRCLQLVMLYWSVDVIISAKCSTAMQTQLPR
jgi:hypothetical protein